MSAGRPRSPLGPIFLIVLVDVLSLTIMIPLLPFYSQAFGASAVEVGFLFAVFSACQLVSGPILGNLSDRHGRRPLLLMSQAGMLVSLLVLAFAESLAMLFVGRIISGFTAGNLTIAQAYITDHTRPEERTRAFGVIGIAFGIGFAIGPAISGVLAQHDPGAGHQEMVDAMARPLFLAAALSALSIVTTATLLRHEKPPGAEQDQRRRLGVLEWRGYVAYFRRPKLRSLLLQFFLFSIAFSVFITGFALFAEDRFDYGPKQVGYVYAYAGVLGILIQGGLLRQLSKRYGDAALVIAGFTASAVGYLILGLVGSIAPLLVAITITSFGHGFTRPALTARVTHVVDRHEQGLVLGLTQSLQSLAAVFAPPLGNLLIEHHQHFAWAAAAAVVSFLALLGALATRDEDVAADPTLPPAAPPR